MRRSGGTTPCMALSCGFVEPMTGIEPAYSAWEVDSSPSLLCSGVVVAGRARKAHIRADVPYPSQSLTG